MRMNKFVTTITLLVLLIAARAQEPDTVKAHPVSPAHPQPAPPVPGQEVEPAAPKIIYYQSTPPASYSTFDDSHRSKQRGDIKTLAGSMNHSGGFAALSFRTSDFMDQTMVLAGFRTGWIVNRTLGIGVEGHGIIPTARYPGIDPLDDVVSVGGYGGMFLELILLSNQVIHVTFPASAGAGWMGYSADWRADSTLTVPADPAINTFVDEDIFWYVEPGANIEINISRNFRLDFGVSRRFTQDFLLVHTPSDAFDQLSYYLTLKVGGF